MMAASLTNAIHQIVYYIWTAKDDGICLKNIPENGDEFRHKWDPGCMM